MSKTYEEIMAEMMAEMPDDVNTEEGSLIYNACAKQALQLEEAYLSMQIVEDNMYTDTQDEEHLIQNGKDKGVDIKEATRTIVQGDFQQEIEILEITQQGDVGDDANGHEQLAPLRVPPQKQTDQVIHQDTKHEDIHIGNVIVSAVDQRYNHQ